MKVTAVLRKNSCAEAAILYREDERAAFDSHPHILLCPSQHPGEDRRLFSRALPYSLSAPTSEVRKGRKREQRDAPFPLQVLPATSRACDGEGKLCLRSKVASLTGLDGVFKYQEVTKEVIEFVHSITKGSLPSRERRSNMAQPEQDG